MGVLIWVYHELDLALDTLLQVLMSLANLIEDGVDDFVNAIVITNSDNSLDKLLLHLLIIQINIILSGYVSINLIKYWSFTCLN